MQMALAALAPWHSAKIAKGTKISRYMDVSKNRGTPKWMVYNGKPY